MVRNLIKTLLFLFFLLPTYSVEAVDVVAIEPFPVVEPISPLSNTKKKKKGFFKRLKQRVAQKKITKFFQSFNQDSLGCDVIYLKDGATIEAKVLEVNTGATLYELCDQENGPKRTILNSKVKSIEYADGYKEVFKTNAKNEDIDRSSKRKNYWGIGFLLGALLGLLGILIAYLIYEDDSKAKRKQAVSGAVIGMFSILLLAFYLASLI